MPKKKFDRVELNRKLQNGETQKKIAESFGVTEGAITKAKKELNIAVIKSTVMEDAHLVKGEILGTVKELTRINEVTNKLLDELTGEDRIIDRIAKAVEASLEQKGNPEKMRADIKRIALQVNRDKNTALKACAEIRNQLRLQLELYQTSYDMNQVHLFQAEVLDAIGEESPSTRERIIQRLKAAKAMRSSVQITQ